MVLPGESGCPSLEAFAARQAFLSAGADRELSVSKWRVATRSGASWDCARITVSINGVVFWIVSNPSLAVHSYQVKSQRPHRFQEASR